MKTHLFVLWTEETIKLVFLSHLQRKRCSASRSIGSDTQSTQTEEKTQFPSSSAFIYPPLSFHFIRSKRKKENFNNLTTQAKHKHASYANIYANLFIRMRCCRLCSFLYFSFFISNERKVLLLFSKLFTCLFVYTSVFFFFFTFLAIIRHASEKN